MLQKNYLWVCPADTNVRAYSAVEISPNSEIFYICLLYIASAMFIKALSAVTQDSARPFEKEMLWLGIYLCCKLQGKSTT